MDGWMNGWMDEWMMSGVIWVTCSVEIWGGARMHVSGGLWIWGTMEQSLSQWNISSYAIMTSTEILHLYCYCSLLYRKTNKTAVIWICTSYDPDIRRLDRPCILKLIITVLALHLASYHTVARRHILKRNETKQNIYWSPAPTSSTVACNGILTRGSLTYCTMLSINFATTVTPKDWFLITVIIPNLVSSKSWALPAVAGCSSTNHDQRVWFSCILFLSFCFLYV